MSRDGIFDLVDFFNQVWFDMVPLTKMDLSTVYGVPAYPPVDVSIDKNSKNMLFEFAVAGYNDDEIEINFSGDYLVLKLETKEKEENKDLKLIHKGIRKQDVSYKYYVPSDKYNQDGVEASLTNGILKVNIPAREEAQKKKILISK